MYKKLSLSIICCSVISCGGGSSKVEGGSPESVTYLGYMKSAYSELLGESSSELRFTNTADAFGEAAIDNSGSGSSNFSRTNVQVRGVDEADKLKFDGSNLLWLNGQDYFYALEDRPDTRVRSYSTSVLTGQQAPDPTLHFEPKSEYSYTGILTHEENAALVGASRYWYGWFDVEPFVSIDSISCFNTCGNSTASEVVAYTWRYSQNGTPLIPEPNEVRIEGSLIESRLIGNKLYLISQYNPRIENLIPYPSTQTDRRRNQDRINDLSEEALIPNIYINNVAFQLFNGGSCVIAARDTELRSYPNVVSITEINIESPNEWRSSCYVGNTNQAFVSLNNVYLSRPLYGANEVELIKFTLGDDGPEYRARGAVNGSLSYDSYYFGEVDGKLAYVNTVYDEEGWWRNDGRHQLSILEENNGKLELVSQIPNKNQPEPIGKPGEQIYAVRFMGQRAYVVTFDKVDPLYVIDLSDTQAPAILGELEIPGFSSYLHVINDDLILGIGKNAVEENDTAWFQGLNIRLFDVSDPSQPIVLESLDYGLRGSETPVRYEPHAFSFVAEPEQNKFKFAIPMSLNGSAEEFDPEAPANTWYPLRESGLYQFEVNTGEPASITEVGRFVRTYQGDSHYYYSENERAVINNNLIYFAHGTQLDVFEWGSGELLRSFSSD